MALIIAIIKIVMNKKSAVLILILMIAGIVWLGSSIEKKYFLVNSGKVNVVTTLFPFYDFARMIGGDKAEVSFLLPPGVDPHSFEPKPGDIFKMNRSDIFIYTGDLMEPWAKDILNGINNKDLLVLNASSNVVLLPAIFRDPNGQTGAIDPVRNSPPTGPLGAQGAGAISNGMDPHIWLDLDNDKIIVNSIAEAFAEKDPANKNYYEERAAAYNKQLADLDNEYASALSSCPSREIIYGGHYAFGYLAKKYSLKYISVQGISPDAEPTAIDLAMLVDQIKKDGIKYVFYEELNSPKIAETLASETGAKLLLLNPGANVAKSDLDAGVSFIDIMNKNLADLKIGLGCQ